MEDQAISLVTSALVEQWPVAAVILLTLYKGIRTAAKHVTELLAKIERMDLHQREHGDRVEKLFTDLITTITDAIRPVAEKVERNSADILALSGRYKKLDGRLVDLEGNRIRSVASRD